MELNKLIIGESDSLTAWIEYKEGMRFKIRYVSRKSLTNMSKNCLVWKFDEKTKTRMQQVDTEKFTREFCSRAIVDWEGVTCRSLSKIIPLDTKKVSKEELTAPIPFSQDDLLLVVKNAYDLDSLLQDAAVDIKVFRPDLEDELGNLPSSPTGT